jgi:hypothetical protein
MNKKGTWKMVSTPRLSPQGRGRLRAADMSHPISRLTYNLNSPEEIRFADMETRCEGNLARACGVMELM